MVGLWLLFCLTFLPTHDYFQGEAITYFEQIKTEEMGMITKSGDKEFVLAMKSQR